MCIVGEGERHSSVDAHVPRLVRHRILRTAQEGAKAVALKIHEFATCSTSMSEDTMDTMAGTYAVKGVLSRVPNGPWKAAEGPNVTFKYITKYPVEGYAGTPPAA